MEDRSGRPKKLRAGKEGRSTEGTEEANGREERQKESKASVEDRNDEKKLRAGKEGRRKGRPG